MSKKDRRKDTERGKTPEATAAATASTPVISRRGWKVVGGGAAIAALGYVVLAFTDPRGQNMASVVSPFLILGGYATIGAGILVKDRA